MKPALTIRSFKPEDMTTLQNWLEQDYIRKFWGDPLEWLEEVNGHLHAEWIKYYIVEDQYPLGFLQYYETDKAPPGEWSAEPVGTVGIDFLIGHKESLGKGYGSLVVDLLVGLIKNENRFDRIIADPVEENIASVKVLEKCGFRKDENGMYAMDLTRKNIRIYKATDSDITSITQLFHDTVRGINIRDYSMEEVEDWSSWWIDHDKWREKINEQYFIKAVLNGTLVGFASLAVEGYLDLLFTHQHYQGQGIAGELLKKIELRAIETGIREIASDVSITARSFFEKQGYVVIKQQEKRSRNLELINYRMKKLLDP